MIFWLNLFTVISWDRSFGRYSLDNYIHFDSDNGTIRISKNSDPDLDVGFHRVDVDLLHLFEFDDKFDRINGKSFGFPVAPIHSMKEEYNFKTGNHIFDRILVSTFPVYHNVTLGRIQVHILHIFENISLTYGPYIGRKTKAGSVLILLEIVDWYWCKPCFNVTTEGSGFKISGTTFGKGLGFGFTVDGRFQNSVKSLQKKLALIDTGFSKIYFPNQYRKDAFLSGGNRSAIPHMLTHGNFSEEFDDKYGIFLINGSNSLIRLRLKIPFFFKDASYTFLVEPKI